MYMHECQMTLFSVRQWNEYEIVADYVNQQSNTSLDLSLVAKEVRKVDNLAKKSLR